MWTAFKAEFGRELIEFRRYPTELISELVVIVVVFYGLFLGGEYISGGSIIGNRLGDVIVSYAIWSLVLVIIGTFGWSISNEAQNGTLEQVCLTPIGIRPLLFLRSLANLLTASLFTGGALFGLMALTGHWISFSVGELVPAVMVLVMAIGLGFLVASVAILFKRSNQFLNLLQFFLLFLVMAPFGILTGPLRLLTIVIPFAPEVHVLQDIAVHQAALSQEVTWLLLSLANMVFFLGVGLLVYGLAHGRAKRLGTLGHY